MAATLVTGLVIEAIQKIASGCSGIVFARSRKPTAPRYATLPLRAIAATAPEKAPASTCVCCQAAIRASRDDEKPSASGSPAGATAYARAAVARPRVARWRIDNAARRRCRRFIRVSLSGLARADGRRRVANVLQRVALTLQKINPVALWHLSNRARCTPHSGLSAQYSIGTCMAGSQVLRLVALPDVASSGVAMSRSAKAEAALALHRFGMGPRPGSIAAIEADPRGALIAELDRPAIGELAAANLPSSAKAYRAVTDAFAKRQAKAIVAKK